MTHMFRKTMLVWMVGIPLLLLAVAPVFGQTVITNLTLTIGPLSYDGRVVETTVDGANVHIKYTCQGCDINFFIADESNFNAWKGGSTAAKGYTASDTITFDETIRLGDTGKWYLVWDNTDSALTTKTVVVEEVTFSASAESGVIGIVVVGAVVGVVGLVVYKKKKGKGQTTLVQAGGKQPPQHEDSIYCPSCGNPKTKGSYCPTCGK